MKNNEIVEMDEKKYKRSTYKKISVFLILVVISVVAFMGVYHRPWVLRKMMAFNGQIWKSQFNKNQLAKRFKPVTNEARINGDIGMLESINIKDWRLFVLDPLSGKPISITFEDILKLPSVTETFEFKCIEGWSEITTFKGVRFSDFMQAYKVGRKNGGDDEASLYAYAGLVTVDKGYYVSMDTKSLMHPQTLLAYEMNGKPLTIENGYPLRLATPVKYGVKNIKQLGTIAFSDTPPADYWSQEGYDDYLGL